MYKKWIVLFLVLALSLAACQPAAPVEEPATEAPVETGPFRVAVVMPSAITDLAFSQSMYDALVKIQNEMGKDNFEIAYSDNLFVVEDARLV